MLEIKFDASNAEDVEKAAVLVRFLRSPAWWDAIPNSENGESSSPLPPASAPSTAVAGQSTTAQTGAQASSAPPVPVLSAQALGNTSAQAAGIEVDKEGIPWDERIHSGNKTKVKDGTWTRKRNVPDDYYNAIKADLLTVMGQSGATPQFGANALPRQTTPPVHTPTAELAGREAPPPPAPQAPLPPQPDVRAPAPPVSGNPFVALMARVVNGTKSGKWSLETINALTAQLGDSVITKISDLAAHHEHIPTMNLYLDSLE